MLCLTLLALVTACSGSVASPLMPTSPDAQEILSKAGSALGQINSFQLDTDVINTYKIISSPDATADLTEWKSTRLINLSTKEMEMTMDIAGNPAWSIQMYFEGGWEYLKGTTPGLSQVNPWSKTLLTDGLYTRETQISYLTEIMNTPTRPDLLGSERVNGIDCYILNITPSVQSLIDWVVSQEQPVGPQIDIMFGGVIPVVRPDAYQSGSVKLWIEKENYFLVKTEIHIDFEGDVGGGIITTSPYTPTTNPVNSSFNGQMVFSNYNQPISIKLPQEAFNAQEH
jgi:hypothetical protein